jgi:hypothetical protein
LTIRQNFLATDNDWAVLRDGIRLVQDVGRQASVAPFVDKELAPGPNASRAAIDAHIRCDRDHRFIIRLGPAAWARHPRECPSSIRSFVCWGLKGCASSTLR